MSVGPAGNANVSAAGQVPWGVSAITHIRPVVAPQKFCLQGRRSSYFSRLARPQIFMWNTLSFKCWQLIHRFKKTNKKTGQAIHNMFWGCVEPRNHVLASPDPHRCIYGQMKHKSWISPQALWWPWRWSDLASTPSMLVNISSRNLGSNSNRKATVSTLRSKLQQYPKLHPNC